MGEKERYGLLACRIRPIFDRSEAAMIREAIRFH
jgi:hypothetical protein